MIVNEDTAAGTLLLISQPDHAVLAAELLALWRTDGMPAHPRRGDLLFAVREHDNGWREFDSAPAVDAVSRRPIDFLTAPAPTRMEVWRRGSERHAAEHPYVAALIAEHARRLLAAQRGTEPWTDLLEWLDERQAAWLAEAAMDEASLHADYLWLDRVDRISLFACGCAGVVAPAGLSLRRLEPATADPVHIEVAPLPFAGATTFRVPCRRVPVRDYASDTDFAVEAAGARWQTLAIKIGGI